MTETFATWLFAQTGRDDERGELARAAQADDRFPEHGDKSIYEGYYGTPGTSDATLDEFERAWNEFEGFPSR